VTILRLIPKNHAFYIVVKELNVSRRIFEKTRRELFNRPLAKVACRSGVAVAPWRHLQPDNHLKTQVLAGYKHIGIKLRQEAA